MGSKKKGKRLEPHEHDWRSSKNPFLDVDHQPVPGICAVCGSSDDDPRTDDCTWMNSEHTFCSSCAEMLDLYC